MVFGNNLIDFNAVGIVSPTLSIGGPSTIGQNPSLPPLNTPPTPILPLEIKKTYTGLTFTVKLDGNNYNGCGPQDSAGNDYDYGGACSSYPTTMTKNEIESKLLKFLKALRESEEATKIYNEAYAQWEQDKAGCESEEKEGSTFSFVNEDRNSAPVGPPTENWACIESIQATPAVTESTDEEPAEESTDEEPADGGEITTQSVRTSQTPTKSLSIGFGQGFSRILQRGVLVGGVLIVGYGAYKIEDKTHIIANLVSGMKSKQNKSKTTPTPKTTKESKPTVKA